MKNSKPCCHMWVNEWLFIYIFISHHVTVVARPTWGGNTRTYTPQTCYILKIQETGLECTDMPPFAHAYSYIYTYSACITIRIHLYIVTCTCLHIDVQKCIHKTAANISLCEVIQNTASISKPQEWYICLYW